MAQIYKNGQISGVVGPVVYRQLDGKTIIQSKPRSYKQTDATVASSKEFGKASTLSKSIRQALHPLLLGFTDTRMYSRFTAAVFKMLQSNDTLPKGNRTLLDGNPDALSHFECNSTTLFRAYCQVQPEIRYEQEVG